MDETVATRGAERLAWHVAESEAWQERMAGLNAKKARKAWDTWGRLAELGPEALRAAAALKASQGNGLLEVSTSYTDAAVRDGAGLRAGKLHREATQLAAQADMLESGEIDSTGGWAICPDPCGKAFRPGPNGYRTCYPCSNIEYVFGSVACIFCGKRHSPSFAVCFSCKAEGRDDAGPQLRALVTLRDGFTCQMCGDNESSSLQVDHVLPCALGGTADPWNLETLCSGCNALKGKRYGALDEMERCRIAGAYLGPLWDFLAADEKDRLRAEYDGESIGLEQVGVRLVREYGTCDEREGLLNALAALPYGSLAIDTLPPMVIQQAGSVPCKGHVFLSTGKVSCSHMANPKSGVLCRPGPCA